MILVAGIVLGIIVLIAGLAVARPAHADPDTDFANQLQGIYGPKDYNAWIGKNVCKRLYRWAGIGVAGTRMRAYILSGVLSGLVAVYTTAEFASARPDAGTSGNGLALPAITIAVLGGVAITGGIGGLAGVLLASVLVVWLNAGIILYFEGNAGSQFQLLALGVVLILAALLNGLTTGRFRGTG
jgi:ribose transport system permease protein/erythritol transport system permease protein